MGACWQVAASMEAFTCGRCRGDRRLSQALRVFSRDTAARCGHWRSLPIEVPSRAGALIEPSGCGMWKV